MAGCTRRQMLWRVLIPSARPGLMVGVNQVIMLSLNMVIIASMIGAGGLGYDVLAALRRLDFGAGLEAALRDHRCSRSRSTGCQPGVRAPAAARATAAVEPSFVRRHPHLVLGARAAARRLGARPRSWPAVAHLSRRPARSTTGGAVNAGMEWINIHLFDAIEAVKAWLLINLMVPLKRLLLGLPWPAVVAAVALAGWQLGGCAPRRC